MTSDARVQFFLLPSLEFPMLQKWKPSLVLEDPGLQIKRSRLSHRTKERKEAPTSSIRWGVRWSRSRFFLYHPRCSRSKTIFQSSQKKEEGEVVHSSPFFSPSSSNARLLALENKREKGEGVKRCEFIQGSSPPSPGWTQRNGITHANPLPSFPLSKSGESPHPRRLNGKCCNGGRPPRSDTLLDPRAAMAQKSGRRSWFFFLGLAK